jgi:hypothetical protein
MDYFSYLLVKGAYLLLDTLRGFIKKLIKYKTTQTGAV